jgi:unsaturated rhamnogalacturonyl hydrolase
MKNIKFLSLTSFLILNVVTISFSQEKTNDVTSPLHLLKADYPTPYGVKTVEEVTKTLDRVYDYLEKVTPARLIDKDTKSKIKDLKQLNANVIFEPGDYRLTSYEWGVTYAGMLLAGKNTGNKKFTDYTNKRLKLIADIAPYYREQLRIKENSTSPIHSVLLPKALDDAGAVCASMIKAEREQAIPNLRSIIDNYIDYINHKEFRLTDGTLARNRPQPNTIWLDDLFMSVPALAQMGKLTGDVAYYDESVKQIRQFSDRMFNKEKGLYMHGWVQEMEVHPEFYWARANGWAIMTKVELLDVLPLNHPGRPFILSLLKSHIQGLVKLQSSKGFWHQLLDKNDSYLETSATAIYTFSIARAINEGWVDAKSYGPAIVLAWNAVDTKVTKDGQVEGTCVGTGMGFDPAFYYYRPVNIYAAHSYGPVLLAGAEMIRLIKNHKFEINDSALQVYK